MKLVMDYKTALNKYRIALKKFAYKAGTNVALYNAERSPRYKKFRDGIEKTLVNQVGNIIENELFIEQIRTAQKWDAPDEMKRVLVELWVGNDFDIQFNKLTNFASLNFYIDWVADIGGQYALDKAGIDAVFNLKNHDVIRTLRDGQTVMVDSLDKATRSYIGQKIAEGRENYLTNDEIARLISDDVVGISQTRAEIIVQTEVARVISTVQLETFKRNGFKEKEWLTSRDERVCPICGPLHGTRISIDDAFSSEGLTEDGPPIHPRCRCDLVEVIPDDFVTNTEYWIGE